MKRRKLFMATFVFAVLVFSICIGNNEFLKKEKNYITSIIVNRMMSGNNITKLDKPSGLTWKDGSTATAKWNSVTGANYYAVNVIVYDGDEIIGFGETGTASTELDLQQEIYTIIQSRYLESYQVTYNVQSRYLSDAGDVYGEYSDYAEFLSVNKKNGIKLATPSNVSIDDNKVARWTNIPDAGLYQVEYTFRYNNTTRTYTDLFVWKSDGTVKNGVFEVNLTNSINNAYKFLNYDGKTVEVSFKVKARSGASDNRYIDGDYSIQSEFINYSQNVTQLTSPSNVSIDDNKVARWTNIPDAGLYQVEYTFRYNNTTRTYTDLFVWKSDGTVKNGVFEVNLTNSINNAYKFLNYDGKTVGVSFKVKARSGASDNYHSDSDYSEQSNSTTYLLNTVKLTTPSNVSIDDNKIARWTNIPDAGLYQVEYTFRYNNTTRTYTDLFVWKSDGTVKNEVFEVNLTNSINNAYDFYGFDEKTVELSFKVMARVSANDTVHINSNYSAQSNTIYYNPNGSTVINNIMLSPNAPVIAVGRSIYIGKTIDPDTVYYSVINWTTSNRNVVSITNAGQITGVTIGTATITAKINNATQTAEVNVYEISSNIQNSTDSQNVIDEANDIIEAVVADGDISNTDITSENKDVVLNEIETGAQNGDLFNVDIKTNQPSQARINELQSEVNTNFSDYSIAGVSDVNIAISHRDSDGTSHRIANITELENEIGVTIDLSNSIPELANTKTREYKLLRKHNNNLDDIDFEINNGIINTNSDKFSEFILLYKDTDIPVTGINLSKESTTISVGNSETITVTILPENAANKNYTSVSGDESKVTVVDNVITAVAPGTTTVTFTSVDGNYSKSITVEVIKPLISISFNKTSGTLNVSETEDLIVTYNPTDTTDNKTVIWTSSNSSIASVNSSGKVTANAPGRATITAKLGNKTATYVVDVKLPLTSISLNKTSGTLIAEREELLTVIYNPSNTTDDKTVTWTSSKPEVATVVDGYVRAISAGDTIITAKVGEKTATYELTVIPRIALTSISLNKTSETLNVGQEQNLIVTYNPTDTNDDKTVTWTTSNASIATVNNGNVKAISPGKATITAKVGEKTATYTVDVKSPLISISLNKTSGTLREEGTETLTVTYNPTNTTDNKTVTWTSSNNSIAKVENGKITAIKVGQATITAKVGDKTATYKLTVVEKETLQEVLVKNKYPIKNEFVHGLTPGGSLNDIKTKLGLDCTIVGNSTTVATGVQIKYNTEIFTIVVYGDLTGDGKINSADLLKMRQHLLGTSTLTGAYKEAGSIATGQTINSADLLRIRQHLLGQRSIEQ